MVLSVSEQIVSRYSSYKLWMTSACVRMYPAPDVSVSHHKYDPIGAHYYYYYYSIRSREYPRLSGSS